MRGLGKELEQIQTLPRVLSFCRSCGGQTPHELRDGEIVSKVCVHCRDRETQNLLDRE